MSDDEKQHDFEKEIEEEIEQARLELTTIVLEKQKNVVLRMGQALEKIRRGERRAGICEEIKHRLREEIARGLISSRTIEAYCKPECKNPAKSKSGKKGAESKKKLLQSSVSAADPAAAAAILTEEQGENFDVKLEEEDEEEKKKTMLITTNGSAERTAAITNNMNWKLRAEELLERLKQKDTIILEGQHEVAGLKEEAQYYKQKSEHSLAVASDPYGAEQQHPHAEFSATTTTSSHEDIERAARYVEFEFWLPFEAVRQEMNRLYQKHGAEAKIWIHGAVTIATGKVLEVDIGRLDNNAATADEPRAADDKLWQ